jgi:hypothetical protein
MRWGMEGSSVLERVEFLEQARLEADEVTVTFDGAGFACSLAVRVVQG